MGSIWRNRAYRRQVGAMLIIGIALVAVCFWRDWIAGAVGLVIIAALTIISGKCTYNRYKQIDNLSKQLERIAAGDYQVSISDYAEGELSILASEILKITTALSHQASSLRQDKVFLADTLADISHQIKTPLTSMSMLTDLLESPGMPEEKRAEFLRGIRVSLDRMQWLIASLLKLSRLDAGAVAFQLRNVPLSDVLKKAIMPLQAIAEQKGQTLTVLSEEEVWLDTDCNWLGEAVGNLLKNCVEHTGNDGQIGIAFQQNPLYTQIQIVDNGPGIAEKDLPYIFDRFYRGTNAAPDSVGIGLALSKSIVQSLGGTLTAENLPQGGAGFTIRLYKPAR